MPNTIKKSVALLGTIALSVTVGCGSGASTGPDGRAVGSTGLKVLATSGPVGDAVRQVLGEHGMVEVMMGPGIDPHLYEEKPQDVRRLSEADVVFYNGLHFEGIHDTLESMGQKKPVFAVSHELEHSSDSRIRYPDGIQALPDPHLWHDASLWADCVKEIANKLAEVDADHAAEYRANAEAHAQELLELHGWVKEQIATIPSEHRAMVTAHDAFGYFSAAYGIETIGLKGVSTEDEIDLAHMEGVVKTVVERKIPAVFVESSVAPRIVEALAEPAKEQGHAVRVVGTDEGESKLFADALGDAASGADTYVTMMQANVRSIVGALGGEFTEYAKAGAGSAEKGPAAAQ